MIVSKVIVNVCLSVPSEVKGLKMEGEKVTKVQEETGEKTP